MKSEKELLADLDASINELMLSLQVEENGAEQSLLQVSKDWGINKNKLQKLLASLHWEIDLENYEAADKLLVKISKISSFNKNRWMIACGDWVIKYLNVVRVSKLQQTMRNVKGYEDGKIAKVNQGEPK